MASNTRSAEHETSPLFIIVTGPTPKLGDEIVAAREHVIRSLAETHAAIVPLFVYSGMPEETLAYYLSIAQGLVLPGGPDVAPELYDEPPHPKTKVTDPDRDRFEIRIAKHAFREKIPTLALCRGAQVLAVTLGGRLDQHLGDHPLTGDEVHDHDDPTYDKLFLPKHQHRLRLKPGTLAEIILGPLQAQGLLVMPSMHHQAVNAESLFRTPLRVSGWSPNGIVEIIELISHVGDNPNLRHFFLGLQGHPEAGVHDKDQPIYAVNRAVFEAFVEAVKKESLHIRMTSEATLH